MQAATARATATITKQRQQQLWAAGDFAKIAPGFALVGEMLCESAELRAGQTVLDVATGSGNTALAAARRWCTVTGIDFVPSLLQKARERAGCEGLAVTFQEGDAESLPFANASFDMVLSTFGAMFAVEQEKAASELLRVCRPGGKVCMANWTPEGFMAETFRKIAQYVPPPAGVRTPAAWGTEHGLRGLFGAGIVSLQVLRRRLDMRFHSSWHWLNHTRTHLGPVLLPFGMLDTPERERLSTELLDLAQRYNRSGDATMVVPIDYLEVIALRR